MLAVDAPIDSLFAARGKAYAVHVQGVEFWRFGRQDAMQGHFSYLELMLQVLVALLRLLFSILLCIISIASQKDPLFIRGIQRKLPTAEDIWLQLINKIKLIMSSLRRNSRSRHQRYEIAIQSDPNQPPEYHSPIAPRLMHAKAETMAIRPKVNLGEIVNKQAYLSTLQEEIELLRSRIAKMEEEDEKIAKKTISHPEGRTSDIASQEGKVSRKSLAGRIYVRASTPSSTKKVGKPFGKDESSSYYKWRPQIDQREVTDFNTVQINASFSPQIKNKSLTNYRVKQKNTKTVIQAKSTGSKQDKQQAKKKFKTEKLLSDNQEEKETGKEVKPVLPQEPQELKKVFIANPEWEITSIYDDFRSKMINKLQVPQGFPLEAPKPTQSLQELQTLAAGVYKLFNISLSKCKEKLIARKFKNGVYFQMKPSKNIVWYYSGAFYFGDWDTDLPSQAEKDGLGFQYIPNKYIYLGQFKNGTRNGKGTIKLISQQSSDFLAYDGEWVKGKPHGKGCHVDQSGNKYIGDFQHGEKTGKAVVLNHDGLYYEGQLKQGLKNGHGTQKLINGDVYVGNFVDGFFEGVGIYTWKNGSVYEGDFSKGRREGKGIWKSYNGDKFEGNYADDLKNGWGKFSWKNGQIYQGEFKDDIRNGVGSYKHPNGKIGTYFWVNGHIDHKIQPQEDTPSKMQQASTNIQ